MVFFLKGEEAKQRFTTEGAEPHRGRRQKVEERSLAQGFRGCGLDSVRSGGNLDA
jgi:hypothetical protein